MQDFSNMLQSELEYFEKTHKELSYYVESSFLKKILYSLIEPNNLEDLREVYFLLKEENDFLINLEDSIQNINDLIELKYTIVNYIVTIQLAKQFS